MSGCSYERKARVFGAVTPCAFAKPLAYLEKYQADGR
jgi:hypothetical protein